MAFLDRQCCGDRALRTDLLLIFRASAGALVAAMPAASHRAQDETAHRLKGSCQGIGAWAMARAAQAVENAAADGRGQAIARLAAALADAERAIDVCLAAG